MKVGDKKQAIGLGIVAVGAIGFLGNSIVGAFGGSSNPTPSPAKPAPEQKKVVTSKETNSDSSTADLSITKGDSSSDTKTSELPAEGEIFLYRDSFVAAKSQPLRPNVERKKKGRSLPGGSPAVQPLDPFSGSGDAPPPMNGKLPNVSDPDEITGKDRRLKPEEAKPKEQLEVRYEGFVEAHSRMAIVSVNGAQITADEGDALSSGVRLLKIEEDRILVIVKSTRKTIWLGKGVKF
jgi:hypothetical protein